MTPETTVVVPAHNEGANLLDTVDCVLSAAAGRGLEVVVVLDGEQRDGSREAMDRICAGDERVSVVETAGLGVAGARNAGAELARGRTIVFLDAHCYIPPSALWRMLEPLERDGVGLVGPAMRSLRDSRAEAGLGVTLVDASLETAWLLRQGPEPYPVPMVIGACQAMRRADFERLGGYDPGMTRWGSEDLELCLRMWLSGLEVVVDPRVDVYHLFRDTHAYPVEAAGVVHNRLRMAALHLNPERLARVVARLRAVAGFDEALARLLCGDVARRRVELERTREHDDDWLLERFGCVL